MLLGRISIALVLSLTAAALSASALDARPDAVPLARLLKPDGSLDRAAASGVAIDPAGYAMTTAADGSPLFRPRSPGVASLTVNPDDGWDDRFFVAGADRAVEAMLVVGNDIYIGGAFRAVEGLVVNHIAHWDGTSWTALGAGMNDEVTALLLVGGVLYAGGAFTSAGGVSASHVARWDGTSWAALGLGTNKSVLALAADGSGRVYAGGDFTTAGGASANRIAQWDGSSWSALGAGLNNTVNALATSGGSLFAGGSFTTADGASANRIARWDGSAWLPLAGGLANGQVYALVANGSDLYVAGSFTVADSVTVNRVARWDGSTWSGFGSGVSGPAEGLALLGGNPVVVFDRLIATDLEWRVSRWDGSSWVTIGNHNGSNTLPVLTASGGELQLAGDFILVDAIKANRLARWDGAAWSPLAHAAPGAGQGINRSFVPAAIAAEGSEVVVGSILTDKGPVAPSFARWDGTAWSGLGGVDTSVTSAIDVVLANAGAVYAGGRFSKAGGVNASNVARWDGTTWQPLGSGTDGEVMALAVSGTDLYVGGSFTTAGGAPAGNLARWDGSAWHALGSGTDGAVRALAVLGSEVIAGGDFTTAGGVGASNVARWDGSAWAPLAGGTDGAVLALEVIGTSLYAAGQFANADGAPAARVARWDGAAWSALGSGLNSEVTAMTHHGADLYVAGSFTTAGGGPALSVARWAHGGWSALGSGLAQAVQDSSQNNCCRVTGLAATATELYAVGSFYTAGGKASARIAAWRLPVEVPSYLGYKVKAPKVTAAGAPIPSDVFPRGWVLTMNDVELDDADADDPENFAVKKEATLLSPARLDDDAAPDDPGRRYLRYAVKLGAQSVAAAGVDGKFPRPAKHVRRLWHLQNALGTITVQSKKASAMLVPASADLATPPAAAGDATHYVCYAVQPTHDITDQTPDAGTGAGKFRTDLQRFLAEALFDDCALAAGGATPSFLGTPVEGACLLRLIKPVELCNPIDKSAVEPPRDTVATIEGSLATTAKSLLCYKAKLASKLTDADAAALLAQAVGAKVTPKQARHVKRAESAGTPVYTAPGNSFPAPSQVDTVKLDRVCIPTDVAGVDVAP